MLLQESPEEASEDIPGPDITITDISQVHIHGPEDMPRNDQCLIAPDKGVISADTEHCDQPVTDDSDEQVVNA